MANIVKHAAILYGKVVTSEIPIPQAVKVCVDKYALDERLKMYFKEKNEVYAFDTNKECNEGDYVIIREATESKDKTVKYNVEKLIYKRGNMVDPVTGKRSAGTESIDDIARITELFGCKRPYQQ